MNNEQYAIDNMSAPCPKCGRQSKSLKCYSLPNYILFLGFYGGYEFKKEVCCPKCMRKRILIKYFTYNIIIGNIIWLIIGLPLGIWKLCSSYTKEHSESVKKAIAEHLSQASQSFNREESHYDQYGNPIYNQKYNIN